MGLGVESLHRFAGGAYPCREEGGEMKRLLLATLVVLLLCTASAAPMIQAESAESGTFLLAFRDDQNPEGVARGLQQKYGFLLRRVYEHALKGAVIEASSQQAAALATDRRVLLIEPNQLYSIAQDGQTVPTGIARVFADENRNLDIDAIDDWRVDADVAVLDTGIDFHHPDLNLHTAIDCTWSGPSEGTCAGTRDDGHGHGTHVAGTIGALDNGFGVVGVAPGVRLWAVKVLTNYGTGTTAQVIAGIDYVAEHADEIEVANMSLTARGESLIMDQAIAGAVASGVTFSLAAGNAASDVDNYHPAGHPDAITVSALADFDGEPGGLFEGTACRDDEDDTLIYFSNYGPGVTVAAPGTCILSTYLDGRYATMSGTSMAAPHVAGAAAILASSGDKTPTAIKTALLAAGNDNWVDDSGDGIQEPLLDLRDGSLFNPTMLPGTPPIALTAVGYKVAGWQRTDLTWTGTESSIDVYRDGSLVGSGISSSPAFYTDIVGEKGAGMHFYQVCESGDQIVCSPSVVVYY
jgi:subtilisin family serine protease